MAEREYPTGGPARPTVAAVLLAAGESRRMGGANKLLLPVAGVAMVRRAAETLLASRLAEIVVVLGHQHAAVGAEIADLPVATVLNRDYRAGQMSSVRAGVGALAAPADGILVALADQPDLRAGDIDFLLDAFAARGRGSIVVPMVGAERGNPIIFAASHRAELVAGGLNFGCRRLIERHPDQVIQLAAPTDRYRRDIDTPEAYNALGRQD